MSTLVGVHVWVIFLAQLLLGVHIALDSSNYRPGLPAMFPYAGRSLTSGFTQTTSGHNVHLSQSNSTANIEQISLYRMQIVPLVPEIWIFKVCFCMTPNWVRSNLLNDVLTLSNSCTYINFDQDIHIFQPCSMGNYQPISFYFIPIAPLVQEICLVKVDL